MTLWRNLLLLCTITTALVSATTTQFRINQIYRELQNQRHNIEDATEYPYLYFTVPVDHFDPSNTATFQFRYYVETKYYKPGGPMFLYNNGEAGMDSYVMGGQLFELANVTNGLVVAVEHRYYGKSIPTKDFSGASLKYLTVAQALADMAYFIQNWEGPKGVTLPPKNQQKWITVGGSYPGDLSAWMRLKYPDIVFASYSSSGPVKAKYDYFEYDLAVGDALGEDCATSVQQAVLYIDSVLDSKDQTAIQNLKAKFGLQAVTASNDFGSALADFLSLGVQYGVTSVTQSFCQIPKYDSKDSQSVEKIIDFFGNYQQQYMTQYKVKATDYNSVLGNDTIAGNTDGSRLWAWQTCLEFAFWQTAPKPPTRRMRSKYIDTNYYESSCIPMFGAGNVPARPYIDRINSVYGADAINMPRIVFINGELDPWRRLSVSAPNALPRASTLDNPVYVIKGGSHCSDLNGYKANENPSKTQVNKSVKADIIRWLSEANGSSQSNNGNAKKPRRK